uniref:J domain-containing protein n=1 Tax=Davidia involucrata TaxID=16924 RepID=A0A5B7C977_DAVIN
MQAYLLVAPTSIDGSGGKITSGANRSLLIGPWGWLHGRNRSTHRRWWAPTVASATINGEQNHYAVLGVSPNASSSDIKKSYRLLALKYHPDVSKDSRADEVFKSIRLAYDILSNETRRNQYDRALKFQEDTGSPWRGNWDYNPEFEDGVRIYRWTDLKRRMRRERYWERYNAREENSSFYDETDEVSEEETPDEERGSFSEVLRSAFLSLFLMQTVGARLSLTFSSLMALLDRKLDAGYKVGYLIAWILGGRGGILLTLCLSFASWVCGKTSSSVVALVVVAMWVGSNLARYAPLPQGALLTLLYMSIKLQVDLN